MPTPSHELRGMRISKLSPGTLYGHSTHEHGWDTVATQCGRPTSPHTPKEHRTGPSTTFHGLAAVETMHIAPKPRQHGSNRTQQAQRTHRPTTPTSTDKRGLPRHIEACCNGLRGASARRARGASAPSRSDQKTPPSRTLQAGEPTAELPAPRREKRSMLQLSRMESRMSSRPPCWPMRSRRSPTVAWTTCGRRAVKVSQAGRHEPGAAPAEPGRTRTPSCRFRSSGNFRFGMERRRLHAITTVVCRQSFHGARTGTRRLRRHLQASVRF